MSIIVNCYNGEAFLGDALDSVLAQDYVDWELILWDDQSTDASAALVRSYSEPRFKYFYASTHTPLGAARRLAIRQASGEWLAFLDQDDVWRPGKLSGQMELVDAEPSGDLAMVYCRARRFASAGPGRDYDHRHEFQELPEGDVFPALMRQANFIAISSVLLSRAAYEEVGGIAAGYEVAAEYALLAAVARGRRVRALQGECVGYRVHGANMTRTTRLRSHQEAARILESWSASIAPALYAKRRRVYQTLIGWEELRNGSVRGGTRRILAHGSLGYLMSRPFAQAHRAVRRRLSRRARAKPSVAGRISWWETRRRLAQDRARLQAQFDAGTVPWPILLILHPGYLCVWLHRISHYLFARDHGRWSRLVWHLNVLATGADIHPHCDLGGGLLVLNPVAASLSGSAGRNLTVMARAGIGGELSRRRDVGAGPGLPIIGDDVVLAPHAGVLGPVRIGAGVRLTAGCIVTDDIPEGAVVVPARATPAAQPGSPHIEIESAALGPIGWRATRARLRQDRRCLWGSGSASRASKLSRWLSPAYVCVLLHRISHRFHTTRSTRLASLFWQLNLLATGADIHPRSDLAGGLVIPNPAGVSLDGSAGRNLTVAALSGCGIQEAGSGAGTLRPELGDDVRLGPQSVIVGAVRLGAGVHVAAGTAVVGDLPAGTLTRLPRVRYQARSSEPRRPSQAKSCRMLGHGRFSSLWRDLRRDLERYARESTAAAGNELSPLKAISALLMPGVLAGLLYRIAHLLHARGWTRCGSLVGRFNTFMHKTSLSPHSCIAGGLYLPHPIGIVFEGRAGRDLALYSHALCVAGAASGPAAGGPGLGERVSLGVHSAVLGPVSVGDDVRIAFKAVLAEDAAPAQIVASPSMRVRVERSGGAAQARIGHETERG